MSATRKRVPSADDNRRVFRSRYLTRAIVVFFVLFGSGRTTKCDVATGERGAVATVQPIATQAGIAAFDAGGNAIDAAVAAALMLGVVDNHNSGIGGGCFILIHTAEGELVAIDGRETAPAAATRDMYIEAGRRLDIAPTELSTSGPLAVATPGAVAAYAEAVNAHGRLPFAKLVRPAAAVAENGFAIDARYAANLAEAAPIIRRFPGARAALLKPDGAPYLEGEVLKQLDLAATYRNIAEHGVGWFYEGPFARRVGEWMAANGGILTADDFQSYRVLRRQPIQSSYRDCTIVGMPPPSSGGVHVAQILNILEHFDLKSLHAEDPAKYIHVVAEAMKLAFADRAFWLGDADFVDVPFGLIDKEYAKLLAGRIDPNVATRVARHGDPPGSDRKFFPRAEKHTTHIAAADAEGNWVAITATVNTSFGAKVIVPGTGVPLNNEMDDFSIAPGVPNAFDLIGAEANAIAPGKRPLSSMSPTIVLRDGRPILTCGAAGGPKIITQVVLTILRSIELEMPLEDAVARPRFHHQWSPDRLMFESSFTADLPWAVARREHAIARIATGGVTQAIARPSASSAFTAVSDPRVQGEAAGWPQKKE